MHAGAACRPEMQANHAHDADRKYNICRIGASVHGGLARVGSLTRARGTRSREGSRRGGVARSPQVSDDFGSHLGDACDGSAKLAAEPQAPTANPQGWWHGPVRTNGYPGSNAQVQSSSAPPSVRGSRATTNGTASLDDLEGGGEAAMAVWPTAVQYHARAKADALRASRSGRALATIASAHDLRQSEERVRTGEMAAPL